MAEANKFLMVWTQVAALLHEWIARLLAERVAASNRTIEALME